MKNTNSIALTVPSPRPRPVWPCGLLNQSAKDAPSGRVTT
jgi:hypothetical protein